MAKMHLKIPGVDARTMGQTEFEYRHQAACGYIRDNVTDDTDKVTCFYCKRTLDFKVRAGQKPPLNAPV